MMNSERRLRLFNLYSSNWKIVHPKYSWSKDITAEYHEAVLCPMCLSVLNASALDQQSKNPLSLEHVPSLELGGKPKILTCKKCNNESGRLLDIKVSDYLRVEPFLRFNENSEILGTTSFKHSNGKKINSRTVIKVNKKKRLFVFKAQIEKGEWREEQLKSIDLKAPFSIDFNFSTPSVRYVHIGLLRIAYLLAFEKFGHAFVLNEAYNGLRHQILEPEKEILEPFGSMISKQTMIPDGIYVTRVPFGDQCFAVVFSLKTKNEDHRACVFLPSPFQNAAEFYSKFKKLESQKFQVDASERFLDVNFLVDPEYAFSFKRPFRKDDLMDQTQ